MRFWKPIGSIRRMNGYNEEKVSAKLDRLRDDKAAGADYLLPRFLHSIKKEIISPIVMLFKKVLRGNSAK